MKRQTSKLLLGTAIVAIAAAASAQTAHAQSMDASKPIAVSIPAERLSDALRQLAEASGLQLVYDTKITDGKSSPAVSGTLTGRAALTQLLAGSGLSFQFSGERTVIIMASAGGSAAADDGIRKGGVVNVEGASGMMPYGEMVSAVNGVNGSRDVEATEGTGSYTTGATSVATKLPMTLRETPQSVSVVTRQQIQDQALISAKDILERLPGITATPGASGEEFGIYSRGFKITTFTFDGGAPISYTYGNRPVIDMSEFDNVQLARGAEGQFAGYGDPGGVVNLVRKKPLDRRQITYNQDIGSFDLFREELDVTGPLTADHKLRGRVVVARQDNKYFYDVANSHKTSVYAALEYDLQPDTLLTVGGSYNTERNLPNQGGLPRYVDGTPIDWPISTCLCASFNYDRATRSEGYLTLTHKFSDNLSMKFNGIYNYQNVDALYYGISSVVFKNGSNKGALGGFGSHNPNRQLGLDYTVTGGIDFLNRHHKFIVGGTYVYANNDNSTTTNYPNIDVANIFNFDPYAYPAPAYVEPTSFTIKSRIEQYGIYASTRLEIFKSLHLLLGLRYAGSNLVTITKYSFSPAVQSSGIIAASNLSKPSVGATFDLLRNFTVYGSHENIYRAQTSTTSTPGDAIPPPITGSNDEVGLKFQSPNKMFNASVGFYNIIQNGFLQTDFANPGTNTSLLQDTRSRGFDVEVTGQLLKGMQVSASYVYNDNKTTTLSRNVAVDNPATSYAPKNRAKAWVTYRPPVGGTLGRVIVGGGIDYQSRAFNAGQVCSIVLADLNARCPFRLFVPYQFATDGYTTYSAKLGYRLTNNIELSLVGKNLTNVKAYVPKSAQNVAGYNFYATPLSLLGSIHFRM